MLRGAGDLGTGAAVVRAAGIVLEPEEVADVVAQGHRRRAVPHPPPPRGPRLHGAQGGQPRALAGRHAQAPGPLLLGLGLRPRGRGYRRGVTATEGSSSPSSPHADVATRLFDGRTWAGSPAVSPDGQAIAFVVSTIDLGENITRSRVWLAGAAGEPAPVTNGPHDERPAWSPDGRWLAFASRRGEKEHESTLHVLPVDGPGEVRTIATMPDGIGELVVVSGREVARLHQPHPRPTVRGEGRALAGATEDRDVLHPP